MKMPRSQDGAFFVVESWAYLSEGREQAIYQLACLLGLAWGGKFDPFDQPFDFVTLSSARYCSDGSDDELVAKVVIEIDLDFWPVFWLGGSITTGELQNKLPELTEIIPKRSAIVDDDVDEFAIGVCPKSQLDGDIGGVCRACSATYGHLDVEISLLCRDAERHHEEDE